MKRASKKIQGRPPSIEPDDAKAWRREAGRQRKELANLVASALAFLDHMDALMARDPSAERGKKIAAVLNQLEQRVDAARYFALGVDFRKELKQ